MRQKKSTAFLPAGRVVSFKLDDTLVAAAGKIACAKGISFSSWLRDAAREKLAREDKRRARSTAAA